MDRGLRVVKERVVHPVRPVREEIRVPVEMLLTLEGLLVHKVHPAPKVAKASQETQEITDDPVVLGQWELPEPRDLPAKQVCQECRVHPECPDRKVPPEAVVIVLRPERLPVTRLFFTAVVGRVYLCNGD